MGALLSSCTSDLPPAVETPVEMQEGTLRPYPSNTASATPLPTDYISPTPSPTITPTATLVYYEVLDEDDMYSIGFRFNVSPQAIMTANPTVNPYAMSVGTTLLIPVTPMPEKTVTATVALSPTATPLVASLDEPDCYPDALGGLWCFVLVENNQKGALENVSGVITLEEGGETRQEKAILPLNLLPAGDTLPLIAYFSPPVADEFAVSAQIDFVLPVMPDDQRYLKVDIVDQSVTYRDDGRIAEITGELLLPEVRSDTEYVWINATAFDAEGHVLGVRRWEQTEAASVNSDLTFNLSLYSMEGVIDRVDLVVEARALQDQAEEE
jgi:LysM repeat protein